jgi:hypothetical protein
MAACALAGGMLVPAYWYPTGGGVNDDWDQLAACAKYLRSNGKGGFDTLVAIGNVNSGPGIAKDKNYESAFQRVRQNGGKVVGYVFTDYGKVPYAKVQVQIEKWVSYYGPELDGIFLDAWGGYQTGNIPSSSPTITYRQYFSNLQRLVKTTEHLNLVVGNPGTPFDASDSNSPPSTLADIFCLIENTYSTIKSGDYTLPNWLKAAGNTQKGCLAFYQMPVKHPEVLTAVVQIAKAKGAAWIYCTDNQSPATGNPWGTLPGVASGFPDGIWNSYWGNEQWSVALAHN